MGESSNSVAFGPQETALIVNSFNILNDNDENCVDMEYLQNKRKNEYEVLDLKMKKPSPLNAQITKPPVAKSIDTPRSSLEGTTNTIFHTNTPDSLGTSLPLSSSSMGSNRQEPQKSFFEVCRDNVFNENDTGPFNLFIDPLDISKSIILHPMSLGKLIRDNAYELYKKITGIKKIGRNRFKIEMTDYNNANQLISQKFWSNNNLVCYIPNFCLFRQGIVRNVDCSLSEKDILENIISAQKVTSIKRIASKRSGQIKPMPLVIITFRGQTLPNDIYLLGVHCYIEPYIQRIIQCFRCFKFGHTSFKCSQNQVCENCSSEGHSLNECQSEPFCLHCKNKHRATCLDCPELVRQKTLKKFMAVNNVSFKEATLALSEETGKEQNSFAEIAKSPPPPTSDVNFPTIIESLRRRPTRSMKNKTPQVKSCSSFQKPTNISNSVNIPQMPIINSPIYNNNLQDNTVLKQIVIDCIKKIFTCMFPEANLNELSSDFIKIINETLDDPPLEGMDV